MIVAQNITEPGRVSQRSLDDRTPRPLCIDLFAGLGGWAEGFLAEGYDVIGFDNHRHVYGEQKYPAQLVLEDVLHLSGKQFSHAAVIVASPPCQEYSWMAMPWSLAKQKAAWYRENVTRQLELNCLFNACFRIAHEAGVPLVVENVKGAQPWIGQARAHYGSFYLWGDIASVGGAVASTRPRFGELVRARRAGGKANPDGTEHPQGSWFKVADSKERGQKNDGGSWFAIGSPGQTNVGQNPDGRKIPGQDWSNFAKTGEVSPHWNQQGRKVAMNFHEHEKTGKPGRSFQSAAVEDSKGFATGLGRGHDWRQDPSGRFNSKSSARKAASAEIAKIPFPLASLIARVFRPS